MLLEILLEILLELFTKGKVLILAMYPRLGKLWIVVLVWLRGLRNLRARSRNLRPFPRHLNPAMKISHRNEPPGYMRGAVGVLNISNCTHQWLVAWASNTQ